MTTVSMSAFTCWMPPATGMLSLTCGTCYQTLATCSSACSSALCCAPSSLLWLLGSDVYFLTVVSIHVCIHSLRDLDIAVMRELCHRVNLVPVIAKADSMTVADREENQAKVCSHWCYRPCSPYPVCTSSPIWSLPPHRTRKKIREFPLEHFCFEN
jgi:hypothetical protein